MYANYAIRGDSSPSQLSDGLWIILPAVCPYTGLQRALT